MIKNIISPPCSLWSIDGRNSEDTEIKELHILSTLQCMYMYMISVQIFFEWCGVHVYTL